MTYCTNCGKPTNNWLVCEDCIISNSPWLLSMKNKEDDLVEQIEQLKAEKAELKDQWDNLRCVYSYNGDVMEYCVNGPCPHDRAVAKVREENDELKERLSQANEECLKWHERAQNLIKENGGSIFGYEKTIKELQSENAALRERLKNAVGGWISIEERLPETDNKNTHDFDVLVYVPKRDGCRQHGVYLGKLSHVNADDGTGNFWGIKTEACEWIVWGWSYFEHPVVTHWKPLPPLPIQAEARLAELKGGKE